MADLTEAYRSRNVCELWLHNTSGLLNSLLEPSTSAHVNDIISAQGQVSARLDTWDTITSEIEWLVSEQSIESEVSRCFTYRQSIVNLINRVDDAIQLIFDVNNVQKDDSVLGSNTNNSNNSNVLFKLPKLTLPPFYGEIVKWTSYWE